MSIQEDVVVRTGERVQGYGGRKSRKKRLFVDLRERWQHSTKLGEDVHRVQDYRQKSEPIHRGCAEPAGENHPPDG